MALNSRLILVLIVLTGVDGFMPPVVYMQMHQPYFPFFRNPFTFGESGGGDCDFACAAVYSPVCAWRINYFSYGFMEFRTFSNSCELNREECKNNGWCFMMNGICPIANTWGTSGAGGAWGTSGGGSGWRRVYKVYYNTNKVTEK